MTLRSETQQIRPATICQSCSVRRSSLSFLRARGRVWIWSRDMVGNKVLVLCPKNPQRPKSLLVTPHVPQHHSGNERMDHDSSRLEASKERMRDFYPAFSLYTSAKDTHQELI